MYRWLATRWMFGLLAGGLIWVLGDGALARTVLDLDVQKQPVALADWGDYWIDPTGKVEFDAFLKMNRAELEPTQTGKLYPLRAGQVLWIRFSVPPAPDVERWYLKLPNPGLDRVTLFTRTDLGWTFQTAGDHVPVAYWPLPHLYPILPLSVSAADLSQHVLRIEASNSFSTPIQFVSESGLSYEQQRISLLHGVYFGLLSMVAIFGLISAVVMRDQAYLWFSLYAMLINVSVATTVGVAGLHLWPHSPEWADAAEYVLPLLSFAPLLVFVALTASLRARSVPVFWLFCALAAGAVAAAAVALGLSGTPRLRLLVTTVLGLTGVGLAGLGWAWYHGDRFARWLLLAFAPMLVALPFPVARWLSLAPLGFWTQHAVQLALGLTLPAVFLLLILRSQERRDYRRRITRLDQVDPLTGLVNDDVFSHRLRGLIERSQRFGCQSAVVLVDFTNLHKLREEFGRKAVLEVLLRQAGRLTSLVREVDTVARVGHARFGVLIEGPVPPERAAALGSKLLARLIMPFSRMPMGLAVRPKVAVAMVPAQGDDVQSVLERLDGMLKGAPPDNRKNIYVADSQPASAPFSMPP
ncbi:MAG: diguanylate cyclase [Ramlibacter sp.]|nr:diguanylate cyclase [Ramlibacter sp.]